MTLLFDVYGKPILLKPYGKMVKLPGGHSTFLFWPKLLQILNLRNSDCIGIATKGFTIMRFYKEKNKTILHDSNLAKVVSSSLLISYKEAKVGQRLWNKINYPII